MNKKFSYWAYAVITALLLVLARQNWAGDLPAAKLWLVNFAWLGQPLKYALLSANTLIFDYVSITLPRSELASLGPFLAFRKVDFIKMLATFASWGIRYLLPFVVVHLVAVTWGQLWLSMALLLVMTLLWLIIVFFPAYLQPLLVQNLLVCLCLLGVRLSLFYCVMV